jgi:hypothetical protein
MVFGIFIDVPLIVGGFLLMFVYRKHLSKQLSRIRIPLLGLYMLLSVPLIIFEEQINCMPAWCGKVLIPPTLPFILVEMFILGLLALRFHVKSALRVALTFSIFGVFWELLLGGLVGAPVIVDLLIGPYVVISYAFVSLLPLVLLLDGRKKLLTSPIVTIENSAGPVPTLA